MFDNQDKYADFSPSDYENDFTVSFSVEARCRIVGNYWAGNYFEPPEDDRELFITQLVTNDEVLEMLRDHIQQESDYHQRDHSIRDHSIKDLHFQIEVKHAPTGVKSTI